MHLLYLKVYLYRFYGSVVHSTRGSLSSHDEWNWNWYMNVRMFDSRLQWRHLRTLYMAAFKPLVHCTVITNHCVNRLGGLLLIFRWLGVNLLTFARSLELVFCWGSVTRSIRVLSAWVDTARGMYLRKNVRCVLYKELYKIGINID